MWVASLPDDRLFRLDFAPETHKWGGEIGRLRGVGGEGEKGVRRFVGGRSRWSLRSSKVSVRQHSSILSPQKRIAICRFCDYTW